MRSVLLLIYIIPVVEAFGQQTADWLQQLESSQFSAWTLKGENMLSKYLEHDLSGPLTPRTEILGYIGNYRRIKVTFNSVKRSQTLPNLYYVSGSTIVSNNKCDFEGTITVEQVREFSQMHYGVDDMYKDHGIKSQGVIIGRYRFSENPRQKHVGIFDGVMTLWWYLDRDGRLQYDDLERHSDQFRNNQYVGTWTEYGDLEGQPCNWGEHRIPFSGDLDIGAGEFSVNPKYYDAGWSEFRNK